MHLLSILYSMLATAGLPFAWNVVARNEYRNKTMTKMFGGQYPGAYVLAAGIFFASLARDWVFNLAVTANQDVTIIDPNSSAVAPNQIFIMYATGCALTVVGLFFVVTAFARLGVTGTYLGDYFGILMKERVTAFPFSVLENPMYTGATMAFLGTSLCANSVAGVFLTAWVWAVYQVSCTFYENPFTSMIYAEAAKAKSKATKSQ
jgi:phosphatidylethanolamine N-methyltransferase